MIINSEIKEIIFLNHDGIVLARITNLNNVHNIIPRIGESLNYERRRYRVEDVTHDYDNNVIKVWIR